MKTKLTILSIIGAAAFVLADEHADNGQVNRDTKGNLARAEANWLELVEKKGK